jgi:hypothetical protein
MGRRCPLPGPSHIGQSHPGRIDRMPDGRRRGHPIGRVGVRTLHFGAATRAAWLSYEDMARFDVVVQCLGNEVEGR